MFQQTLLLLSSVFLISSCLSENTIVETTAEPTVIEIHHNPLLKQASIEEGRITLRCQTFSFPLALLVDGQSVIASTGSEFASILDGYFFGLDFEYPIITESGTIIENAKALVRTYSQCIPKDGWANNNVPFFDVKAASECLQVQYPITLSDSVSTLQFESQQEVLSSLAQKELYFNFPLILATESGEVTTVQDAKDLIAAVQICQTPGPFSLLDLDRYRPTACYEITLPHDFIDPNGDTFTLEDYNEYLFKTVTGEIAAISYPMVVTDAANRSITLDNDDEWSIAINACKEGLAGDQIYQLLLKSSSVENGINCFDLVYPFSLITPDLLVIEILSGPLDPSLVSNWEPNVTFVDFVYPVTIELDNDAISFESYTDLLLMQPDCG